MGGECIGGVNDFHRGPVGGGRCNAQQEFGCVEKHLMTEVNKEWES